MSDNAVQLVSWDRSNMTAVLSLGGSCFTVVVPISDPSFTAPVPTAQETIAWLLQWADKQLELQAATTERLATLPDLSSVVGTNLQQ